MSTNKNKQIKRGEILHDWSSGNEIPEEYLDKYAEVFNTVRRDKAAGISQDEILARYVCWIENILDYWELHAINAREK